MRSKFASGKWIIQAVCVAALAMGFSADLGASDEPLRHRVNKGDTLWSISQKYLGTPDLWPRLWAMNPFVTNPHLLKPGDMIRIGVHTPASVTLAEAPMKEIQKPVEVPPGPTGIRVGSITNLDARSLFSVTEERPWGTVQASDSGKLLLTKGDFLYIDFTGKDSVKSGDVFAVFRPLSRVKHPITGEDAGTIYSARAKVVLKEQSVQNIYRAQIEQSYTDVNIGDLLFPFAPKSPCLMPLPSDPGLYGAVIAADHLQTYFGRNSIVFLDKGRDEGLLPGSVLELVKPTSIGKNIKVYEKGVGRMIVLDSAAHTATALVLSTVVDLRAGAPFRGFSSLGTGQAFPRCPAQP